MTGQKKSSYVAAATKTTTYEISKWHAGSPPPAPAVAVGGTMSTAKHGPSWEPVGTIDVGTGGAQKAIREWAEAQGEKFTGARLRAVPTSYITELQVTVETKRQLTLGAP